MIKTKKLFIAVLSVMLVISLAMGIMAFSPAKADSVQDMLLFSENFDSLTTETFNQRFMNVGDDMAGDVQLVDGGVSNGGKMAKISNWSLAQAEVDFTGVEGVTLSAWVLATNSEQRIFSVQNGMNYFLKGGNISNDDHSVVAWCNTEGKALVNHDPAYSGIFNATDDTFYRLTVTVTREYVKFYKNNLLIDAYYTCNDRNTGDIQKFIDNFYIGMKNGMLGIGGGVLDSQYLGDYYIDSICVYGFAAESYSDFYAIASYENDKLSDKYKNIVAEWKSENSANEKEPIIYYDFSNVSENVVANTGSQADSDATVVGDYQIQNGRLVLDGGGYLSLPQSLFPAGTSDFSISMDIKRSTKYNADMFYTFSPESYEKGPNGLNFVDCWMKTKSDDPVPVDISWIITDYCDTGYAAPHWNLAMTTPDLNEFTLTNVYKNGTLYVYVNGFLMSKTPVTGGILPENFTYGYIGRGYWDRSSLRGEIDNVAIYDYALEEETMLAVSNKLNITVDMPSNASDSTDISNFIYYDFARFDEKSYSTDVEAIKALDIDYTNRTPQSFKLKEGVTVKVYFRDIINLSEQVTYGVTDVLPQTVNISYTDGTTESLAVEWESEYAFGGASEYTGSVTDRAGRQATVTYAVTYQASKDELKKLIDSAAEILTFAPLYDGVDYKAFENAVLAPYQEAQSVYENSDALETEILNASVNLKAALDSVKRPLRSTDIKIYSVSVIYNGTAVKVYVTAEHIDTVTVQANGIELKIYSTTGTADTLSGLYSLDNGNYELKIVRKTAESWTTSVLDVYLIKDGEICAQINYAVSENVGSCTVENSTVTDVSLIYYYVNVSRNKYTNESLDAYDKHVTDNSVAKDVSGWLTLTAEQLDVMTDNAKTAFEKLVITKIKTVTAFNDIICKPGTDVEHLIPKTATVTYDNGIKSSLKITWDNSSLDTSKVGEYTLNGTVIEHDGTTYSVSLKIIVNGEEKSSGGCGSFVSACGFTVAIFTLFMAVLLLKRKIMI